MTCKELKRLIKAVKKEKLHFMIDAVTTAAGTLAPVLIIKHGYRGLYPDNKALEAAGAAARIAAGYGRQSITRGGKQTTYIYI